MKPVFLSQSELRTISTLATHESASIHDLFGERLPEFPAMQERILELVALAARAEAALKDTP